MVIRAQSLNDSQYKYLEQNRDFIFNDSDSTFVVLDDFIYVIGDNNDVSEDSRKWGPVAMNLIYGRVFYFTY